MSFVPLGVVEAQMYVRVRRTVADNFRKIAAFVVY